MPIYRDIESLPLIDSSVVTVGSFDGVHLAHQSLLRRVLERSRVVGAEGFVVTFEPHPRIVLGRAEGFTLLTTVEEKIALLSRYGVENVLILPFSLEFSKMDYHTFIRSILLDKLSMREMVVGFNHRLGHDAGNSLAIGRMSEDFALNVVERIESAACADKKISSTLVRQSIEAGDFNSAVELLAHPYLIYGRVANGELLVDDNYKLIPSDGRYLASVDGCDVEVCLERGAISRVDKELICSPKVELKLCLA